MTEREDCRMTNQWFCKRKTMAKNRDRIFVYAGLARHRGRIANSEMAENGE
jgi:hypothetical protein